MCLLPKGCCLWIQDIGLKGQGTSHRVVCQEAPGMVHHSQGQGFKSPWKILCQVTLASASHKNESLNSVTLHVVYVVYTFVCFTRVSVPIGNSRPYMCMIWSEVAANACLVPRLSLLQPGNEARLMHEHYYVWTIYNTARLRSIATYITVLGFRPIVCRLKAAELNVRQGNQSTLLPLS